MAGIEAVVPGGVGHRAIDHDLRRLAAAEIEDHLRRQRQPGQGEGRIDAPLEPVAGVGTDLQRAAGGGDGHRIPIGGFDENVGGGRGAARGFAAHDARERLRAGIVGDEHHAGGCVVGPAVERRQLLSAAGGMDAEIALDLACVEDMERAVQAEGEVVGDIDEGRDRAEADRLEPGLHPCGRGAVGDTADHAAREKRAAFRLERGVDRDADRAGKTAGDVGDRQRLQRAQPARGQIAGDAPHAERIGPVGRDLDEDHRIVEAAPVDVALAEGRVVGQLDDAVVVVGNHQLAFGAEHAVRFDAPDHAGLEIEPGAGNAGAHGGEHADEAGAGVRRAADDLHLFAPAAGAVGQGFDPAEPQAVGIRMGPRLDHAGDAERAERGFGIFDALDLVPEIGQRGQDRVEQCHGLQMVLEPVEGELHRGVLFCGPQAA